MGKIFSPYVQELSFLVAVFFKITPIHQSLGNVTIIGLTKNGAPKTTKEKEIVMKSNRFYGYKADAL